MSQEGKIVLESILGKLLGFDEGAGDLLNHLLTIEVEEDLKEYLSQLLGSETPEIKEFVMNMGRYQHGEEVFYKLEKEEEKKKEEPTKSPPTETAKGPASSGKNRNTKRNSNTEALLSRRNQANQHRVPPPSKKVAGKPPPIAATASEVPPVKAQSASTASTVAVVAPIEKSRPLRGNAEFVCGCMGTKYKALTNCLYCGRIICEREGYGYCPYCGYAIEEIRSNGQDKSWIQKERLLRFDREFARRTQIFDDQADFQGPATWMSEEERDAAEQKQEDRLDKMRRPKQVLNLNI